MFRGEFDELPLMVGVPSLFVCDAVVPCWVALGLEVPWAVDFPWTVVHVPGKTRPSIEVDESLPLMVGLPDLPSWLAAWPET